MVRANEAIVFDQINLHHCREATSVLRCRLDSGVTGVSLVQEPYCFNGGVRGLGSSGNLHVVLSQTGNARACVYTARGINAILLREFSSGDFTAVRIQYKRGLETKSMICCSCYLPYEGEVPTKELALITAYCLRNNLDLIVGCDANSHHVMWGSSDTNSRGRKLMEFICESGLVVLNRGNRPTFSNRVREEVIDITLCTPSLEGLVGWWRVSDEDSMSDHATINFALSLELVSPIFFRNPRKTNWESFEERVRWRLSSWDVSIGSTDDLDAAVSELTDALVRSYEEACPLRRQSMKRKTFWFNSKLARLKAACNYAWNHRLRDGMEALRAARNAYKKECRKSKRDSWRSFCESVEGVSPTARLHKLLSKDRLNQVDSLRLPGGEIVSEESQVLKHLMETHFPDCVDSTESTPDDADTFSGYHLWRKARRLACYNNIRWALGSFQPFKSAGSDKLFPALLQHSVDTILHPLHEIFSASLVYGYIPRAWQQVKVIFIPKPGRATYDEAKSHRPISLSSFLLKTLERLVDWHVRTTSLRAMPLCHNQHAYQRGKSTMSAIHKLTQHVESTLECSEHALACFLDIEGAFDRASFESFRQAALEHHIDPLLIRWVLGMLRNRVLTAQLRTTSVSMRPVKGCPQGGVLSPLIWILIADGLIRRLNAAKIFNVGYADDFSIITRGKFISAVYDRMSTALEIVCEFTQSTGLSVNPSKTGLMLFTRSRKLSLPCLSFQGQILNLSDRWKILGLEFDNKLNWGPHVTQRAKKACMVLGQCRRVIGRTWGLSPKSFIWLYTMVVLPLLSYGAVVWWRKASQVSVSAELNHVQRLALLCISGAMSTTPTAALEILLGFEPLDIRIEAVARAELHRLHCWNQLDLSRGGSGHVSLWRSMVREQPLLEAPSDYMVPCCHLDHAFRVFIPDRSAWDEALLTLMAAETVFFTDGSLKEGLAGAGVYSAGLGISSYYSLGPNVSVFQAEIFAILACALTCLQMGISNSRIFICIDSQAALRALGSRLLGSKLVLECFRKLNEVGGNNELTLVWVPGHSGIEGNERVDELANMGSDVCLVGPLPSLPLSKTWAKQTIKEWVCKRISMRWKSLQTCRQTRVFIREPLPSATFSKIRGLPKHKLRVLVGVLTGHYLFKKHLYNLGVCNTTLCHRCGFDEDTAFHLVCNCPALAFRRKKFFGDFVLSEEEASKLRIDDIVEYVDGIEFLD